MNKLTVQRLKGFNDFFADDMKLRRYVISVFEETFEKYGYEPLETPALEMSELMLGQSGEEAEKLFYRFDDPGGRDVMLKYEVMTSMCRAVAQNINNIKLPYKRYQIQRVWRAENVQRGRYRELTQCDADTVGSSSMTADAEFIQMGIEIVGKFGFNNYFTRISNRKFLMGIAEYLEIPTEKFYGFAMSLDKLLKIGREKVVLELVNARDIAQDSAEKALELVDGVQFKDKTFRETIEILRRTAGTTDIGKEGLDELEQIVNYLELAGVDPKYYRFDTSLARGLASYTGPIWEFEVADGGVGSIAGCGRYDNLIGRYLGGNVPATGGSFGIERVCDILKDRQMLDLGQTTTDVLVTLFDEKFLEYSLSIANKLRKDGLRVMLYPEAEKIGKQFKYADAKGIKKVVVIGSDEIAKGVYKLKDLETGIETEVSTK